MTVIRAEEIAPSMRRIVLGGEGFADFLSRDNDCTDKYVKLVFLADGFEYPEPLDLDAVKESLPHDAWPVLRTYTIRWVDVDTQELAIDFVVHGTEGIAGPWAAAAEPGDVIHLRGPSGAFAPDPTADWHLFVGDEAGLPAIAASIESLPAGASAVAFVEVDGPADEITIPTEGDVEMHWLHRGDAAAGTTTLLDDAVRAWQWPGGRVQAFIHGESSLLKTVRAYVVRERRVARSDVSVSAYWREGTTEEGFRAWKSEQAS